MRNIKPKQDQYLVGSPSSGMKKGKSKPIYPTVRIDLDHLPEAKDWKVGTTYHLEMDVKMTGLSQGRFDNSAEFEIRKIGTEDAEEQSKDDEAEEAPEGDDDHG